MNENTHRGPNVGLLLLIPAVALMGRAAMRHHRAMWAEIDGPAGIGPVPGHGHHPGPGGGFGPGARDDFRLPPRIEWMLKTWHDRAHHTGDAETVTV